MTGAWRGVHGIAGALLALAALGYAAERDWTFVLVLGVAAALHALQLRPERGRDDPRRSARLMQVAAVVGAIVAADRYQSSHAPVAWVALVFALAAFVAGAYLMKRAQRDEAGGRASVHGHTGDPAP